MPVVTCTFTPTQDNPAARPGAIPQLGIHRTLTAIGVTIGSLLAADLLYRWVEVPMIDVGRRIVAWRKERADRRTAVALSRDRHGENVQGGVVALHIGQRGQRDVADRLGWVKRDRCREDVDRVA